MFGKVTTALGMLLAFVGLVSDQMPLVCYISNSFLTGFFDNPCEVLTKIVGAVGIILAGLSTGLTKISDALEGEEEDAGV
jgi:hypothetical protein